MSTAIGCVVQADSRPTLPHRRSTGDGGGDRLTAGQSRELVDGGSATTTASRAAASELEASSASCRTTHLHSFIIPSRHSGLRGDVPTRRSRLSSGYPPRLCLRARALVVRRSVVAAPPVTYSRSVAACRRRRLSRPSLLHCVRCSVRSRDVCVEQDGARPPSSSLPTRRWRVRTTPYDRGSEWRSHSLDSRSAVAAIVCSKSPSLVLDAVG